MKVGQLRKIIKDLDDDVEVLRTCSDYPGFEPATADVRLVVGGPAGRQETRDPRHGKKALIVR